MASKATVDENGTLESPAVSSQDKCSRNKRKFPTDSPALDTLDPSVMESAYHDYGPFPTEASSSRDLDNHVSLCSTCRGLMHSLKEALYLEDARESYWSGMTETHLEEVLLSNLDAGYESVIKRITSYGYKESVAINALLNIGHCYGCKDPVVNIAEHALEYLASGKAVDVSERENGPEQIRKLERRLLDDMVDVLIEMRPFFGRGDAMWCLLMCDMNLSLACTMDSDTSSCSGYNGVSGHSASQLNTNCNSYGSGPVMSECNVPAGAPKSSTHPPCSSRDETSSLTSNAGLPSSQFYASRTVHGSYNHSENLKENSLSSSKSLEENVFSYALPISSFPREKSAGSKKWHASTSRARCRSNQSNRNGRVHADRSGSKLTKNSNLAKVLLHKKNKSVSGFISDPKSTPLKLDKTVELVSSESVTTQNFSFTAGSSNTVATGLDKISKNPSSPPASSDASLSLSTDTCHNVAIGKNGSYDSTRSSCNSNLLHSQVSSNSTSMNAKDELLVKLLSRVEVLKTELQDWTDWGQQKVMQAARRLNQDKVELQNLRQERDEAARLLKEKETLEVSTMKKVAETEYAWSKACSHYESLNANIGRLENQNHKLRQELEVAKTHATELAINCQDASMREIMTQKKKHSWEKERIMLAEELASEKQKLLYLTQKFQEANEYRDQCEDRWKLEVKARQDILVQVAAERNERERIETSAKLEESAIVSKAESDLQRYKEEIRGLEDKISKVRINSYPKIPELSWDTNGHSNAEILDSDGSDDEVPRDRECVMCLTEEMSVVFLPCSHQVVCAKCNELHEKQGMKDCPSCRTPIQRRIHVRPL
ncbi:MND1-interacting protein 1-like [Zingiber officinale]|uniref:RING-type domain-containing protein n=1 Tax=Zingiber officinale TaxID=94328 RepID=A0A8J5ER53_ZINOF|nr:MND1-interacting protein 1-like [Zingiber officinale]KAG6466243.1 hypothetical protein ZIOFF_075961 [Zingiber officinale]